MAERTGFKVVDAEGTPFYGSRTLRFSVGETHCLPDGEKPTPCKSGFHYCPVALDCLRFVDWDDGCRLLAVAVPDGAATVTDDGYKYAASALTVVADVTADAKRLLTGAMLSTLGSMRTWTLYRDGGIPSDGLLEVFRNSLGNGKGWCEGSCPVGGIVYAYHRCVDPVGVDTVRTDGKDRRLITLSEGDPDWPAVTALLAMTEPFET
jgi:hypothetical protein